MRINDQNLTGISSSQVEQTQATQPGNRQSRVGRAGGAGEDQVQLSNLAGSLQELAMDSPERAGQVEKLAKEYQEGRYSVDSAELSRKIVDDTMQGRA